MSWFRGVEAVLTMGLLSCAFDCCRASASTEESTLAYKRPRSSSGFVIEEQYIHEVEERIRDRTKKLKPFVEQAHSELTKIIDSLTLKAKSIGKSDLGRAVELVRLLGNVRVMISSTMDIKRNLEGRAFREEDPLLNKSVAIIASAALSEEFNELMKFLVDGPDTHDIDCRALKVVSEGIYEITKDIPTFTLE